VVDLLRESCQMPISDVYGSTEAGGILVDGKVNHRNVTDVRLEDVPELEYRATDLPFPRGELLVKTKTLAAGYFKHPDSFAEVMTGDGFYRTGDIVEQHGPDAFAVIDRRKNIIKLSQGEFVSVARIEAALATSPMIHQVRTRFLGRFPPLAPVPNGSGVVRRQVFLYGTSHRAYLVAVVVPSSGLARAEGEIGQNIQKQALRGEIQRIAREKGLQGYEVPRDFIIEYEPFSRSNSLMTDSNKPARLRLRQRYSAVLEGLYETLEARRRERLDELKADHASGVVERVHGALELTLGLEAAEVAGGDLTFMQLGGDSLSAVRLVDVLRDLTGADLPVSRLLAPTCTIAEIAAMVEQLAGGAGEEEDVWELYEKIHGTRTDVSTISADDLKVRAPFWPSFRAGSGSRRLS
jgi:fatty acid CoA ligase FadD9